MLDLAARNMHYYPAQLSARAQNQYVPAYVYRRHILFSANNLRMCVLNALRVYARHVLVRRHAYVRLEWPTRGRVSCLGSTTCIYVPVMACACACVLSWSNDLFMCVPNNLCAYFITVFLSGQPAYMRCPYVLIPKYPAYVSSMCLVLVHRPAICTLDSPTCIYASSMCPEYRVDVSSMCPALVQQLLCYRKLLAGLLCILAY